MGTVERRCNMQLSWQLLWPGVPPRCGCSLHFHRSTLQVRRGLGDRAPAVRAEVSKLVMQWLEDSCDGEPLRLVHQLDVQRHPGEWAGCV